MQQAGEKTKEKSRQEIEADKEAERAYRKSLGNIPDQAASDPWGNVRSKNAPKAAAKTPAKRAKTDGTAQLSGPVRTTKRIHGVVSKAFRSD